MIVIVVGAVAIVSVIMVIVSSLTPSILRIYRSSSHRCVSVVVVCVVVVLVAILNQQHFVSKGIRSKLSI